MKQISETQKMLLDLITQKPGIDINTILEKSGLKQIVVTNGAAALAKEKLIKINKLKEGNTFEPIVESKATFKKEEQSLVAKKEKRVSTSYMKRNKDTYEFEGNIYKKGRLVLAIITAYLKKNPKTTFVELEALWPKANLQKGYGVFQKLADAKKREARFFMEKEEVLSAGCGTKLVVTREWGSGNIGNLIKHASTFKFVIKIIKA